MKLTLDPIYAMAGRMTPRERRLSAILVAALFCTLAGGSYLVAATVFGGIRDEIEHGRQILAELRQIAPRYQELADARRQIEDAIRNNKAGSVRVAANDLLRKIELADDVPGATGNRLSDIVSFEGKTTETAVESSKTRKKPSKAKGKESGGAAIVEVEQNLEFREVPVENALAFLDAVEQSKDLLFTTKIDMTRRFNNLTHVRAVVTIATFQYLGQEEGPEATTAAVE